MTKDELLNIITTNLFEIIPELEEEEFSLDESFVDLGMNSIDRGELITMTLESLESDIPRVEFVSANSINDLLDLFAAKAV